MNEEVSDDWDLIFGVLLFGLKSDFGFCFDFYFCYENENENEIGIEIEIEIEIDSEFDFCFCFEIGIEIDPENVLVLFHDGGRISEKIRATLQREAL